LERGPITLLPTGLTLGVHLDGAHMHPVANIKITTPGLTSDFQYCPTPQWKITWYLPQFVFLDPFQISNLLKQSSFHESTNANWTIYNGHIELEQHASASTALASVFQLSWPAQLSESHLLHSFRVPLHTRYIVPNTYVDRGHDANPNDANYFTTTLPPAILTLSCAMEELENAPWDSFVLYPGIHVIAANPIQLKLPVGNVANIQEKRYQSQGAVLLGVLLVTFSIYRQIRQKRIQSMIENKLK
jgi:hypothetical protein